MDTLDRAAIVRGAGTAALIAVPAGVVQNLVGRDSALALPLFLVILFGLGAGGFVAGRAASANLLVHGALAALSVYVVVQAVGVLARLVRGEDVSWLAIPFFALFSLSCGMVGGYLAFRRGPGATP